MTAQRKVLVFGGTGMIGHLIVRELCRRGVATTIFSRSATDVPRLAGLDVGLVQGDITDPASIDAAFEKDRYDVVIASIARNVYEPAPAGVSIYAIGNNNITHGSARAEVEQVIQIGTVGSGNSAASRGESVKPYAAIFRDKTNGENTLIDSGLNYTIIRTGIILPGEEASDGVLSDSPEDYGPVRIGDIARLTADCVGAPGRYCKIYHTIDRVLAARPPEWIAEERAGLLGYKSPPPSKNAS